LVFLIYPISCIATNKLSLGCTLVRLVFLFSIKAT
jgi:hypothetical protein